MSLDWIHIPTPGDHYSSATGSATIALIHEITLQHLKLGGRSRVVVGHDTMQDYAEGECVPVRFKALTGRWQKACDTAFGRLGVRRYFEELVYAPANRALEPGFAGSILVYNAPGAARAFKRRHPRARVFLYAVNALFRTYTPGEVAQLLKDVDGVVCCSRFIAEDLRAHGGGGDKVFVVHHGVNTQQFQPSPSPGAKPGQGEPRILFVGRMVPEKGADLLLRAVRALRDAGLSCRVRIVGSQGFAPTAQLSPYEAELRELAEPIRDLVEFQPSIPRSELAAEYAGADIFCAPSNWDDPFPLTVLEAMASGVPTVASRRGGIPEVGDAIRYFDPPDTSGLVRHLSELVHSHEARKEWGCRARAGAERLSWESQYALLRETVS